ncbi:hypothetical protein [Xanthomonas sp. 3075]|uniref:hypothetical protein n=1 Tax=Xanthomonas sp. 3075 TaxID=3035315 RepID=UPI00160E9B04|nr:hypothetical protein [Xanthomonas sp. 3075]MBB4130511.1 hypothetical protein [Xanthomonas sp. 3075]
MPVSGLGMMAVQRCHRDLASHVLFRHCESLRNFSTPPSCSLAIARAGKGDAASPQASADNAYSHGASAFTLQAQARALFCAVAWHCVFVATHGDKHWHA